ncbi:MAG TPA: septal ring lytic transglycosylase RlpA family protein [Candidatus Angelobacter sp.]
MPSLPPPTVQPAPVPAPAPPGAPAPARPEITVLPNAKVLYTETGYASWYGPHYNKRRAANGEVFDTDSMTAAHLTIPLNSIARVTNVKTGDSVVLRITDRGPFVNNRIIDLSKAAALKLGVYRPGTALVKIEVLESPVPIDSAGRWCVQIGGFKNAEDAAELKEKLTRRYSTAKVLQFTSPIGEEWLRIRVAQDDKKRAENLIQQTATDAGVYLVRLD